ncbi:MAG: hypothetical protein WCA46_01470 [Actinocatenispora sp.]
MRDGYYARWRDDEYEASPDGDRVRLYTSEPANGFERISQNRYLRVVPRPDVTDLGYQTRRCMWRDQPFQVIGEHGQWLRLEYLGELPAPEDLGLSSFDRDVYQVWARSAEVGDVVADRS